MIATRPRPAQRASRNVPQGFNAQTASLPAPVGGWNARDSLAAMDEKDAVELINWWPSTTDVMIRKGYGEHATGMPAATQSLLVYNGPTASEMFAAAGSGFYDITTGGTVAGNYLDAPIAVGASGASTPDSVATSITGDIDLRIYGRITNDTGPLNDRTFISKFGTAGNRSYAFVVDSNGIRLVWSTNGTTISAANTGAVPQFDVDIWYRVTLDVDDGAGQNVATFYTSTDGSTWTQFDQITTAGTTSIFDSAQDVFVGTGPTGGADFNGKIYQALIYDGIGGTLAAGMIADEAPVGSASWSAGTGEAWTVLGAASIVGTLVVSGLSNAKWQYENFANSGGNFLLAVNGADKLRGYDGTNWWTDGDGTHDITGVDTANIIHICVFKRRIWLIEKNSLSVWYLGVDAIAGAATEFDLSSLANLGGYLMAMGTWTIDSGTGADDLAAFVTSEGQVIVYKGINPTNEVTWVLIGVFNVGAPFSRRCLIKYGGDMLLLSVDGLYAMSSYLQSDRVNAKSALTDKIQNAVNDAIVLYGSNFGWEPAIYDAANMILLNVPITDGASQEQYVMNALTGAWARFQGWEANCWAVMNDSLYFGGDDFVGRAWYGLFDNVSNIDTVAKQAFNYFGSRGQTKRFTMMRPLLNVSGAPAINANVNVDYSTDTPTTPLSFTDPGYSAWDDAEWDDGLWGGGLNIYKYWNSINGVGYCAAPILQAAAGGIEVHWLATDIVMEPGGVL